MLFEGEMTAQSKSSYIVQYLFESMFVYYILRKQKGAAQHILFGENIRGKDVRDLSNMSLNLTSLCLFAFMFAWHSCSLEFFSFCLVWCFSFVVLSFMCFRNVL